jgi:hypothetical protein
MGPKAMWHDHLEPYVYADLDGPEVTNNLAAKSQAVSLKRIADALEVIAAKPAIDNDAIYRAISEAGFAVLQHMRNG